MLDRELAENPDPGCTFHWRQPAVRIPGYPRVEAFFHSNEETFVLTGIFKGASDAYKWIRNNASRLNLNASFKKGAYAVIILTFFEHFLFGVKYGLSDVTLLVVDGQRTKTLVTIKKKREYFTLLKDGFQNRSEEMKRLKECVMGKTPFNPESAQSSAPAKETAAIQLEDDSSPQFIPPTHIPIDISSD